MPRKGENIYKRKDGRWEGRYIKERTSNKTCYGYIYGKTYKDVKTKLILAKSEWKSKQNILILQKERENILFSEIAKLWLESSAATLKESTVAKYRNLLSHYILPVLGKYFLSEITNDMIYTFGYELLKSGGKNGNGLSPKTVSDSLSVLKSIQNYAVARNIDINFSVCHFQMKQSQKVLRVFSLSEQQRLYQYLKVNQTFSNLGILLCLFTGIRVGELCALKWEDISVTEKTLYIHKTMQRLQREENNCSGLRSIEILEGVTSIGEGAFFCYYITLLDFLEMYCVENSYAHEYAIKNNIDYVLLGQENDLDSKREQENTTDSSTESDKNSSSNNANTDKDTSTIIDTNLLIDTFSLAKTANGTTNKTIIFPGRLKLSDTVDADGTYIDNAVNTIQWTSSDSSVVEVTDWLGVPSMDKQAAELLIYLTPYKVGEAVITGTTANGLQASCVVTVSAAKEKDSLETVIKTDKVKDTSYGVVTYEKTEEGKIYELVVEFYEAMNAYLEAVKTETEKDLENWEGVSVAQKLRQMDEASNVKMITMEAVPDDDVLDAVYEALAIYLENYTRTAIDLGKIDVEKNSIVEIDAKIVNEISKNIGSGYLEEKIGKYVVIFDTTEAFAAYSGKIRVENTKGKLLYQGWVNTNAKKTAEVLEEYINELSDTVKDLLKDSLKSIFKELDEIMGISELSDEVITELFQDCVDDLQKNGYGDVLRDTLEMYESYDLIKSILKGKDAENLEEAYKNASTIYKKLKAMDYSDEAVSKRSVKLALDKVNKVKGNLEDALYDYIYGTEREEESAWETFKKLFIQCPVDFTVYALDGTMLGYVKNGDVYYDERILIELSGDVKTVYVPENLEVTLDFVATGNGEMNYIIEEVQNGTTVGRMNYYAIPLVEGEGYTQTIYSMPLEENTMALPVESDNGEVIYADEYLSAWDENASVTITCQAEAGGVVIGSGNYPKGNPVELFALPEEDKFEFVGWYKNGTLVEKNSIYRFTALEDTDIYAKFVEKPMEEPSKELLQVANVKLDKKRYNYNGKAKKPSVSVLVGDKKLQKGIDYEVSYQANKEIGTGIVVVTGIGEYTGELTKTFKIVPKKTSIVGNIKEKADGFVVNWKKVSPPVKGYQIQYSSSSEFDKNVTWKKKVKKNSVTKLTVSGLENGETYYVRVRTYKKVDGKKYCSGWSKVKNVTIKKK